MDCAGNIRRQLGPGYLEAVYKNAMLVELRKNGLSFEVEKPIESFVSIVSGSHKIVCSFVIMSLKDSYYVYES